jgi:toxin CptA
MHSAPSVSYPAGRSRFAAALLLLAWLLGGAVTALWWLQSQSPGWRLIAACLVLAAAGAFAAWNWWHSEAGMLAWGGETWSWSDGRGSHTGTIKVSLDLQRCVLLRWTSEIGSHWFWLERARSAERWDDLRRAVYSRARLEVLPDPRAPAAKP